MDACRKNIEFNKIVNNINLSDKSIREFYDEALSYSFEYNEEPLYLQEDNIKRTLVNSLRHNNIFDYDKDINKINKIDKKNKDMNYKLYKNKVLNKIGEKYPFLEEECIKQMNAVDMVTYIEHG